MKIAYYSPLPPARTGVADYSAALIRALRHDVPVDENPSGGGGIPLYHTGNNPLHRDIYARALAAPGVAVLHDAVLHHFLLGTLDRQAYIDEFAFNYGEWNRGLARSLWRDRGRSAQDPRYFQFPMLRRIVEASHAVIVHNPAAAAKVRQHCPAARVFEIPHLAEDPPPLDRWAVERLRHSVGVPAGGLLFGVFGHLRESKRVVPVLRAFQRVRNVHPSARLLIAGGFASRDLERAVAPMLAEPGVIRRPFLAESDFWRHASAVDVCINLRYPTAGETSGIAIRLMSLGKTVLLSDDAAVSRVPEAACLRVATGAAEQEMLETYLVWLCETPDAAAGIGAQAAALVRDQHAPGRVARAYLEAVAAARE